MFIAIARLSARRDPQTSSRTPCRRSTIRIQAPSKTPSVRRRD